ncbi:MAG: glutamine synthetase III [Oscillospiraceae bacterium]|jgi:glutamine synthetase|nr:glutamine synthetase III [Oscillospiraceae bacterium]
MGDVISTFGSLVFGDAVMRRRLPKEVYRSLKRTIEAHTPLDPAVASVVAAAMKNWACEHGVTHFTHWFQPMTGVTAEKHDAFVAPDGEGRVIMEFSGKELVRGEPDASSFPTGGLRATFEARGYTAWDPTSYAFLKGKTLYIPTAFCSYGGEALDQKTPLLRSMQAIGREAKRILALFGEIDPGDVTPCVGAEQEYFLIDRAVWNKRPDLIYCGRTLFGARPPKGQDLDDHYFGAIKPRVAAFMQELDEELWKLGVLSKTKHNEVAPAQHEFAPVFETVNIAVDHNQLTMELMKTIAGRHGLVCLLHEKPFAGVNGSGKHNNWSLGTATGENLLDPGRTPAENARFLLFLLAVIKAVDEHQDLLRISVATAGNDHRLGANEAPPAIISIFLGDELTEILTAVREGTRYHSRSQVQMAIGVDTLPHFPQDMTDRNRTSPFAFTGNKFEFRMLGAPLSLAGPNIILNTIVADTLAGFADALEGAEDFSKALDALVKDTLRRHGRIIFNGNNYAGEWVVEAQKRGLLNLTTTVEALPLFASEENIRLFERHGVLSRAEVVSRMEIMLENYAKTIHIEALTMIDMTRREVVPAVVRYTKQLADSVLAKRGVAAELDDTLETELLRRLTGLAGCLSSQIEELEASVTGVGRYADKKDAAFYYQAEVFFNMQTLRGVVDELEMLTGRGDWPFPSYGEILFSVV